MYNSKQNTHVNSKDNLMIEIIDQAKLSSVAHSSKNITQPVTATHIVSTERVCDMSARFAFIE